MDSRLRGNCEFKRFPKFKTVAPKKRIPTGGVFGPYFAPDSRAGWRRSGMDSGLRGNDEFERFPKFKTVAPAKAGAQRRREPPFGVRHGTRPERPVS